MTAAETCGCGATFTVTSAEASALIALNAWRRNHPCKVRASSPAETLAPGYGVKSVLDEINSIPASQPDVPERTTDVIEKPLPAAAECDQVNRTSVVRSETSDPAKERQ